MPLTLTRRINGEVVPFKLSVFEAFLPLRMPKKKKDEAVLDPAPTTGKATNCKDDSTATPKQSNDDPHAFTAAEDAKLIDMKAANKSWKEIAAEMKKSQSVLRDRFKEIGKAADDGAGDDQKGAQPHQTSVGDAKGDIDNQPQSHSHADTTGNEPKKARKGKDENRSQNTKNKPQATKSTAPEATTTSPTAQDPLVLTGIIAKYDQDKWRYAASKYYDLTGVRISKEEAKRRAEEIC